MTTNTTHGNTTRRESEHAAMVRLETRHYTLARAALESELAQAYGQRDAALVRMVRCEIGQCDRALMELAAGRLPLR